jgi:hypothetical protein
MGVLLLLLKMLGTYNCLHPIFIYICIQVHIFSPSENLVSCSLLTSWLYSLSCVSYGDVICGTSCFCSLSCVSRGVVICGTSTICLTACTIIKLAFTNVDIANGSIFPLIILCALKFVFSYSLFIPKLEVLPSSTLFFFLKALLGEFFVVFFWFYNVLYISSLIL